MKPNLLTLALLFFSASLFSQQCSNDSLFMYPAGDISYSEPGFIDPNNLPCVQSGAYSELVIPYKTYNQGARLLTLADSSTIPVTKIYSMKIENITNLPSGMCWITRPSNATISGDQVGVLIIKGTTSVASGVYPLTATLSIDVTGGGSFTHTSLLPFNYKNILSQPVLKVADSGGNCPAVN